MVAAFRWWAESKGLPADTASRIPFGRTSTDAAAVLAPHLRSHQRKAPYLINGRSKTPTASLRWTAQANSFHRTTTWPSLRPVHADLAEARLKAAKLPTPQRFLITPECWSRGKPDPEPYLRGAQALGAAPEACIVLEDAPSGVESGVRAGMRVIGILTTHTARSNSRPQRASHQVLRELPDALRSVSNQ